MGDVEAAEPSGIPQLLASNTLVLNGALFLGILALHTVLEDSTINNNWVSLVLLSMALALLIKSADVFIEGAKGLAYRAGLPEVVIGLTIVSIGTSLPEILVTSTAASDIPNTLRSVIWPLEESTDPSSFKSRSSWGLSWRSGGSRSARRGSSETASSCSHPSV